MTAPPDAAGSISSSISATRSMLCQPSSRRSHTMPTRIGFTEDPGLRLTRLSADARCVVMYAVDASRRLAIGLLKDEFQITEDLSAPPLRFHVRASLACLGARLCRMVGHP